MSISKGTPASSQIIFLEKRVADLEADNERLRAALLAFAWHFGPLEDNELLHEDVRRCFALARAALGGEHE